MIPILRDIYRCGLILVFCLEKMTKQKFLIDFLKVWFLGFCF